jgi:hypothetical protein
MLLESIPAPPVDARLFYSYMALRAAMFVALGFLSPLAFWRFDRIGYGVLFACGGAFAGELIQAVSPGHSSSFREFAGKVCLLLLGFALALAPRYDRRIRLGPIHIPLYDRHRVQED